jgi:hypothetical protein
MVFFKPWLLLIRERERERGKKTVSTEQETRWAPTASLKFWRREKSLAPTGDSQPGSSSRSLVTIPTSAITISTVAIKLCLNFHSLSYIKPVYINS